RDLSIIVADVVGYSRLMAADESSTYRRWSTLRAEELIPCIAEHRGSIVKHTGDGFLAVFESPRDAGRCAIALQRATLASQQSVAEIQRISLRIGVHAAKIIVESDDIYGDGVNIAARLQTYAPPGGIVMSTAVVDSIGEVTEVASVDLGDLYLHNMPRPV